MSQWPPRNPLTTTKRVGVTVILGLGHDVVDVGAFAEQLEMPGTRMQRLFSARERRQASLRASIKHDGEALHLAAKWAAKESVVKAWCEALAGRGITERPYTVDDTPWSRIEIVDDATGCPRVVVAQDVHVELCRSLAVPESAKPVWHVSISHDGGIASAVAVLDMRE